MRSFAIVDAHGYYIEHDNNIDLKDVDWSSDYTSKEILAASGNAVILIRNPFEAIHSYRHLTYGSHAGDTTAYQFFGKGNKNCFIGYDIMKYNKNIQVFVEIIFIIATCLYRLG